MVLPQYAAFFATTRVLDRAVGPIAHDFAKLLFVRDGAAEMVSECGELPMRRGDVALLDANTLCLCAPYEEATVTTIFVDHDYLIDQHFWRHAPQFVDRLAAGDEWKERYAEPVQVVRPTAAEFAAMERWLDELVTVCADDGWTEAFFRAQAYLSRIMYTVEALAVSTPARQSTTQRRTMIPAVPRHRGQVPIRAEARQAADLLHGDVARRWSLEDLAVRVHLSRAQLSRVFVEAFGKTPHTYLTMLRAEQMARLLRETDMRVDAAARKVGWRSRGHAAKRFAQSIGVTPSQYRAMVRGRDR